MYFKCHGLCFSINEVLMAELDVFFLWKTQCILNSHFILDLHKVIAECWKYQVSITEEHNTTPTTHTHANSGLFIP